MKTWLWTLALVACETTTPTDTDDTAAGLDSGDTADSGDCSVAVIGVTPTDGAMAVYYRDPVYVSFDGDGSAAQIEVRDAQGVPATMAVEWTGENNLATLRGVLQPSAEYVVHTELCGVQTDTHFSTSSLGSPLTIDSDALTNRTYSFSLADAEITEPEALEILGSSSLTTPLGFMVQYVDDTQLELLGSVLAFSSDGIGLEQVTEAATWDFPAADFTQSPYFHAQIDMLIVLYPQSTGAVPIQFYDFDLQGVFTADGTAIEHGEVTTLVDTRGLGPLLGLPDADDSVCTYAAPFQVECIPCPDAEPYCIYTVGEDITAPWAEGLTISPWPVQ